MPKGYPMKVPPGMKHCPICNRDLPLESFYKVKKDRFGRFAYCKECTQARNRSRTAKDRRKWHLNGKFGLSLEEYQRMHEQQNGVCAICEKHPAGRPPNHILHVDHCHITGKVRVLLCFKCNQALGAMDDDPRTLSRAVEYLLKHFRENLKPPEEKT